MGHWKLWDETGELLAPQHMLLQFCLLSLTRQMPTVSEDARGDEYHQVAIGRVLRLAAEELSEKWDVAEDGYLAVSNVILPLRQSSDYDCLAILHPHRTRGLATADRWQSRCPFECDYVT